MQENKIKATTNSYFFPLIIPLFLLLNGLVIILHKMFKSNIYVICYTEEEKIK